MAVDRAKSRVYARLMDDKTEARLEELTHLRAGWLDGEGEPIHWRALALARRLLNDLADPPTIYPMPNGGVQLCWGQGMVEVEFTGDGAQSAYFYMKVLENTDD